MELRKRQKKLNKVIRRSFDNKRIMLHCSVIGLSFTNSNFHWQRVRHNEAEYISSSLLPFLVPTEPKSVSCEQEEHHHAYLQRHCFFNVSYTEL